MQMPVCVKYFLPSLVVICQTAFEQSIGQSEKQQNKNIAHYCATNLFSDPVGGLKYSIKMLSREEKQTHEYTNANGRTIYGRCETSCTTDPIPEDLDESESKL